MNQVITSRIAGIISTFSAAILAPASNGVAVLVKNILLDCCIRASGRLDAVTFGVVTIVMEVIVLDAHRARVGVEQAGPVLPIPRCPSPERRRHSNGISPYWRFRCCG